ncbi:hypothetical protein F7725_019499 [Dissostichus mawsoni]|uniref:Neuroblastoma-amplified sequence N-terminal domain-containing protein n=1 Tax=Dissostichus mawsoni TaxID=36200 RepID=A0A7J5YK81_DISMA|nr:hypothetical protein F7725_019499 [Dissostichus mawsoni]
MNQQSGLNSFHVSFPSSSCLPLGLVRLAHKQINWQLVLASNGKLLAVVQDQCVEISAKGPKPPVAKGGMEPRLHPAGLRRQHWHRGLFDLIGSELFVIPPSVSFPGDFSCAVAGLIFLEDTGSVHWSAELLVITYGGGLKSYLVRAVMFNCLQHILQVLLAPGCCHKVQQSGLARSAKLPVGERVGNFGLPKPVRKRSCGARMGILLLVGGCESGDDCTSKASCYGITAWRTLSGSPHYKQVTSYEDDVSANQKRGFFKIPSFRFFARQGDEKDGVFRMSLSPDGALLAVIHFSGRLSLWDVPSLKQRATWSQDQQPGFDEINPEWKTSLERRKKIKDKEQYYPLEDVSWWSDVVLILARCSGSVTVSSVRTLRNLLGKSCEWFEPSPRVTAAHEVGFLSLECEVKLAQKRGRLESNLSGGASDDEEGMMVETLIQMKSPQLKPATLATSSRACTT